MRSVIKLSGWTSAPSRGVADYIQKRLETIFQPLIEKPYDRKRGDLPPKASPHDHHSRRTRTSPGATSFANTRKLIKCISISLSKVAATMRRLGASPKLCPKH